MNEGLITEEGGQPIYDDPDELAFQERAKQSAIIPEEEEEEEE